MSKNFKKPTSRVNFKIYSAGRQWDSLHSSLKMKKTKTFTESIVIFTIANLKNKLKPFKREKNGNKSNKENILNVLKFEELKEKKREIAFGICTM